MSLESDLRPSDLSRESLANAETSTVSSEGTTWSGLTQLSDSLEQTAVPPGPQSPGSSATPTPPATAGVPLDDNLVALRLGDAWYAVELARIPTSSPERRPFDVVAGATVYTLDWYGSPLRDHCPHDCYAAAMRRLTLGEQRRLGVSELLPTPMFVRRRRGRLRLR